ncbi:MAG: DEAD/DEAH box helicase [Candidatus Marsarchaeota archaeon]
MEGLHPAVEKLFRERFGALTPPQELAIPHVLSGENVLLIAPTGSGKTEAALIPILSGIVSTGRVKGIKALYITPLRALNRDMMDRISWWSAKLDIRVAVRHGDTPQRIRREIDENPPDLLITTPETLQAILVFKRASSNLSPLKWVVVDEVHELASSKRGAQLAVALERLRGMVGDFQVIGLSATVGTPEEVGKFLVGNRPITILRADTLKKFQLTVSFPTPTEEDEKLAAKLYTLPDVAARLRVMKAEMEKASTVLLFTNTRSVAEALTNRFRMWDERFPIGVHHGSLAKSSRLGVEKGMKEGSLRGVICTSSLELGIDVGSVDLVIQHNSPRQVTRLVQRVGRAGHTLDSASKGFIVTMDEDDTLEALVIVKRLMKGLLEPVRVLDSPLDVLMHQLVGLLVWKRKWAVPELLSFFRRSYPFKGLSEADLRKVIAYMDQRKPRLLFYSKSDDSVSKPMNRKPFYDFYFDNLSMIPEEKQFLVVEEVEGREEPVGVLDEAFVGENGVPGVKFVEMGSVWEIKQVFEDKVYVQRAKDPLGAIPSWEGEEIPVPYEVAHGVGAIRAFVEEGARKGMGERHIVEQLLEEYPWISQAELARAVDDVYQTASRGMVVPTSKRVVIEVWQNYLIVHSHAGLLENRCLARVFAHVFSKKTGLSLHVTQDAYRWAIRMPEGSISPDEALRLSEITLREMSSLSEEELRSLTAEAMESTGLYKRRLVNAGRKMGAISKKADISSVGLDEIAAQLKGTVVHEQAMKDVMTFDVNVQGAHAFLQSLRREEERGKEEESQMQNQNQNQNQSESESESEGKNENEHQKDRNRDMDEDEEEERRELVSIVSTEPSAQAYNFLQEGMRKEDVVAPERLQRLLEASVKQRLYFEPLTLACTACGEYVETRAANELPDFPSCPFCGSKRLGVSKEGEERVWKALTSKGASEARVYSELRSSADLVEKYGKRALLVLAGRGIEVGEAKRILESAKNESELVRDVMEAERKAMRRRFLISNQKR